MPAELPQEVEAGIRAMAAKAFRAVGCDGMARADFFESFEEVQLLGDMDLID